MSLIDKIDKSRVPSHVAIIMDGNGRWAKKRGLERGDGHKEGIKAVRRLINAAVRASVKYVTIYAFSTENWNRPAEEVRGLMDLMVYAIKEETAELIKNGVKLKSIGDRDRLPEHARESLDECIDATKDGENVTLIIALSYSSKWELTNATKSIGRDLLSGVISVDDICEETITSKLTTYGIPDPDLLIRTGGEQRISNFLLWQSAYTELYFTDTYWPDFDEDDLYNAIIDFQGRERRFGKTSEQLQ
ncbi:MAG: isoprenyl transferase [Fermentimonas sp.]|jgi:undecaprenyl diphosphate synthase